MSGDDAGSPDDDGADAAGDANGDVNPNANVDADAPNGGSAESSTENSNVAADEGPTTDRDAPTDRDTPSHEPAPGREGPDVTAAPTPTAGTAADARRDDRGPTDRIGGLTSGAWMVVREMLISVGVVAAIGLVLFAVSGVWPPMVAVESGSMQPHMYRGDLVVISEPGRYVPDATYGETGVVTRDRAEEIGYRTFGDYGSVVVYRPNNATTGSPVIHRAHFFVEEGENWFDEANPEYHDANSCTDLPNCPAPNSGFITKGDHNPGYDQVLGISAPVAPDWIVGVAHLRIPYLGHVRLWLSGMASPGQSVVMGIGGNATGSPTSVGVVGATGTVTGADVATAPSVAGPSTTGPTAAGPDATPTAA